jgi:hypothetical protein
VRGGRKLDRERERTEEKEENAVTGESIEMKPIERRSSRDFRDKEKREWRSSK